MKCKTCGKRFKLLAKNRYEVAAKHIFADYYNAFDCPYCGCQNIESVGEKNRVHEERSEVE